jgi:hypothetical protein
VTRNPDVSSSSVLSKTTWRLRFFFRRLLRSSWCYPTWLVSRPKLFQCSSWLVSRPKLFQCSSSVFSRLELGSDKPC